MTRARFALIFGLTALGATMSHADFYYTRISFLAAIKSVYYEETFSQFDGYDDMSLREMSSFSGSDLSSGYSWTAAATGNSNPSLNMLYAINPESNGALSVSTSGDVLSFAFGSSKPVTAFGGNFFNTDTAGGFNNGTITLQLSSGDFETSTPTGPDSFLGYVGTSSILSASVTGDGVGGYGTADNVITGQGLPGATPEPFTMGLGLASAAVFVRRRLKAKKA